MDTHERIIRPNVSGIVRSVGIADDARTFDRAYAANQAQCVAVADQETQRALVLVASEIMSPPVKTTGRGHCRGQIRLEELVGTENRKSKKHTIANPTKPIKKLAVNHP